MVVVISGRLGIFVSFCVGWSDSYMFLLLVAGVGADFEVVLAVMVCGGAGLIS
ncbi:transmembrane protein, putative [Medicago truncatula]|uniref:Transmembrane protein, putative n=1 Tax=Medicago truncatula TaxID=3880 RepID=G7JIJ3_MEDTR|nr:transmembrane protein, putative [Medicago truncatula]